MKADRLENIKFKIEEKAHSLPNDVSIVGPEDDISADTQADWLISLLSKMYVEHGITKRRTQLVEDIEKGKSALWFATKNDGLIASAALVVQSDGAVELGRAVSLERGVGGLLMLLAAKEHLENSTEPLVAEVRLANEYEGIPSGEATQKFALNR